MIKQKFKHFVTKNQLVKVILTTLHKEVGGVLKQLEKRERKKLIQYGMRK
jgi:hypothetical protein